MVWFVVILAVVFVFLLWSKRNPYVVTRTEMKEAMEQVLQGTMPAKDWEKLVRTPIKRDRYLNSLREKLNALPKKVSATPDAVVVYDAAELAKIVELVEALKKRGLDTTIRLGES